MSVYDANEVHMHQLRVPAEANNETIQEALNILFEIQQEHIDVQKKSILKTT